jgi:hypothetical protein
MARIPIASGDGSRNSSTLIVDTGDTFQEIKIQNVSAVDVYVSEDRARLDATISGTNLPQCGLIYTSAAQLLDTWQRYQGKLYARSQAPGGAVEVITNALC